MNRGERADRFLVVVFTFFAVLLALYIVAYSVEQTLISQQGNEITIYKDCEVTNSQGWVIDYTTCHKKIKCSEEALFVSDCDYYRERYG